MPSIYDPDVEILSSEIEYPFIIQKEKIEIGGDITILEVVYTVDGFYYVGATDQKDWLIESGITEQIQPSNGETLCTCSIGFNPTKQQWFGFSHRASYGFGIGSEVRFGDCAYKPKDIEDFNRYLLDFWSVDAGVWRECESPDITCTTILISIESNIIDPQEETINQIASIMIPNNPNLKFGTLLKTKTIFKGISNRDFEHANFNEYPEKFGKGEWIAETLEDAKIMAIDFADGVG
jgi:hypothetical protein